MKCYSIVAGIALVVIVYAFSALVTLPWYLYLPFIAIFVMAYQGDKFIRQLVKIPQIIQSYLPQHKRNQDNQVDRDGKRM